MPDGSHPRRAMRIAIIAAGCVGLAVGGLTGGLLAPAVVQGQTAAGDEGDPMVEILVARRIVPAGTELGYAVVMRAQMPARFVSDSMVRPEHVGQLVGEPVLMTILEGDPILWSHLAAGAPEAICDWVREANRPRHGE
jgi:Flp pilus assembly protein CpaB